LLIEVIGYKGIIGNATYQWLSQMKINGTQVIGRDKGDRIEHMLDNYIISFICVPEAVVPKVAQEASCYAKLIVIRSTVPPGTCQELQEKLDIHICHNPEFLTEKNSVQDAFNLNRVVIGACCQEHGSIVKGLYKNALVRIVVTDTKTSEMVKIATNNYLACQISFWNEIESIAKATGVSGHLVGNIASLDPRVSAYGAKYHHKYSGKCLPKEMTQMISYAKKLGIKTPLLNAIQEVNDCQTS